MTIVIDPGAAAWIRAVVLAKQKHLDVLVDVCPCQWGRCGHCDAGRHKDCTARARRPRPAPETYLTWRGMALVKVWRTGRPCSWRCPCGCVDREAVSQLTLGLPPVAPGPRRPPAGPARANPKPGPAAGQGSLFDVGGVR